MLKKLLICTALLAVSTAALSHASYKDEYNSAPFTPVAPTLSYTNTVFYAGPYAGLSVGPRVSITKNPSTYVGIEGTLSVGYSVIPYPNFYFAGEAFGGNSANVQTYQDALFQAYSPRTSWGYGVGVIPGIIFNGNVLGYLRLGVMTTRFRDVAESGNTNTNILGAQAGLGAQTSLCPNLDIRGEYIYNQYRSYRTISITRSHQFNVGLVYKFL